MNTLANERLLKILLAPHVSEKSSLLAGSQQYVFKVLSSANKLEIKRAVELLFQVKVEAVRVSNVKGKVKRFGRMEGKRKGWKKAYVTLSEGQSIALGNAQA